MPIPINKKYAHLNTADSGSLHKSLDAVTAYITGSLIAAGGAVISDQNIPVLSAEHLGITASVDAEMQNVLPATDSTYDLGSEAKRWDNVFVNTLDVAHTVSAEVLSASSGITGSALLVDGTGTLASVITTDSGLTSYFAGPVNINPNNYPAASFTVNGIDLTPISASITTTDAETANLFSFDLADLTIQKYEFEAVASSDLGANAATWKMSISAVNNNGNVYASATELAKEIFGTLAPELDIVVEVPDESTNVLIKAQGAADAGLVTWKAEVTKKLGFNPASNGGGIGSLNFNATVESNGLDITLNFDSPVTYSGTYTVDSGLFLIVNGATLPTIYSISAINDTSIQITLSDYLIGNAEAVSLIYVNPGINPGIRIIDTATGLPYSDEYYNAAATNNSVYVSPLMTSATIAENGTDVTINFDKAITVTGSYSNLGGLYMVAGSSGAAVDVFRSVNSVTALNDTSIQIELNYPIYFDEVVQLGYKSSFSNIGIEILDATNPLINLSPGNSTTIATSNSTYLLPQITDSTIETNGTDITINFSKPISYTGSVSSENDGLGIYNVTSAQLIAINGITSLSSTSIQIHLNTTIYSGETVNIFYNSPNTNPPFGIMIKEADFNVISIVGYANTAINNSTQTQ